MEEDTFLVMVSLFVIVFCSFGLLNVIIGVIVERTLAVAKENEQSVSNIIEECEKRVMASMKEEFQEFADNTSSGEVNFERFCEVGFCSNSCMQRWMNNLSNSFQLFCVEGCGRGGRWSPVGPVYSGGGSETMKSLHPSFPPLSRLLRTKSFQSQLKIQQKIAFEKRPNFW